MVEIQPTFWYEAIFQQNWRNQVLIGKHCHAFFSVVCFSFSRNNACKNAGFPEPAMVANASFADSIVWRNKLIFKALFGKDTARKKTVFLHTLFVENERETSELK